MGVVLIYNEGLQARLQFARLIELHPGLFKAVVEIPALLPDKKGKKNWRLLRKLAASSTWYLWINVLTIKLYGIMARLYGTTIKALSQEWGIEYRYQDSFSQEFVQWLAGLDAGWIINASGAFIGGEVLSVPKCGVLNFHGAPLPQYQGAANYFWVLGNGESQTWGTLHYVDEALDTGDIVKTGKVIDISKETTVFSVWKAVLLTAHDVFLSVLPYLDGDRPLPATPQNQGDAMKRSLPSRGLIKDIRRNGHRIMTFPDIIDVFKLAIHKDLGN